MNNSNYGKTFQNDRNHLNIRIVTSELRAKKFIAFLTFQSFKIINREVAVIKMMKSSVLLNKPIYVGMSILDISKLQKFNFHYDVIVKRYGDMAKLLFTDTDSLCYQVFTDDLGESLDCYDMSDYPEGFIIPTHQRCAR